MATPSNEIHVPKPAKSSYNPDRPISKNTLLLNQVQHFREIEKRLPPDKQSGMDFESIKTERHAAEYIRKLTAVLHPHGIPPRPKVKKAT